MDAAKQPNASIATAIAAGQPLSLAIVWDMSGSVVRQFMSFAAIGVGGFVVDSGVLLLLLHFAHWDRYSSRLVSFLCAASFTWAANRLYTFKHARKHPLGSQWLRFVLVNGVGGLVNLGVYAWLVSEFVIAHRFPVLAVGAGSIAGLAFNFSLSRAYVFRH